MIPKLFWTVFTLEALGLLYFIGRLIAEVRRGGPDAGMGSLAILLVIVVGLVLGGIGLWYRSTGNPIALGVLLLPGVVLIVGSLRQAIVTHQVNESFAGNEDFKRPGMRALANAIAKNDVDAVKAAIPTAGDLNVRGETGTPILLFAVASPGVKVEILQLLLDAGANPNIGRDPDRLLPLEQARHIDAVKLLLDHGADPNARGTNAPAWFDALTAPTDTNWEALQLYLAHGARFDGKNHRGEGPAGAAAQAKNWRALRRVLEAGARGANDKVIDEPILKYLAFQLDIAKGSRENTADLEAAIALLTKETAGK